MRSIMFLSMANEDRPVGSFFVNVVSSESRAFPYALISKLGTVPVQLKLRVSCGAASRVRTSPFTASGSASETDRPCPECEVGHKRQASDMGQSFQRAHILNGVGQGMAGSAWHLHTLGSSEKEMSQLQSASRTLRASAVNAVSFLTRLSLSSLIALNFSTRKA